MIRIWSNDVIENLDGVLQMLLSELEKQPLTPALSRQSGAREIIDTAFMHRNAGATTGLLPQTGSPPAKEVND